MLAESRSEYTESEREVIHRVFYRPTQSWVGFNLFDDYLYLDPYQAIRSFTTPKTTYTDLFGHLGGTGITNRDISEIEEDLPTVKDRIDKVPGKIVFAGNGLSDVPLLAAERYRLGQVQEPPVVVDVVDYHKLLDDFDSVHSDLLGHGISLPRRFGSFHTNLRDLVEAERASLLKLVCYFFGAGQLPDDVKNALLVVNCYGPEYSTITEQLSALAVDGELYGAYIKGPHDSVNIPGFHLEVFATPALPCYRFKRLA